MTHQDGATRILSIEDNTDVGDQLLLLLRHSGYEARLERTGEAGIAAVSQFKPEVVLLDIGLPDLDGHDVARRIRGIAGFEHVVIIAVSGYSPEAGDRGPDSPFDDYLAKPVSMSAIEDAMERQMVKRQGSA
jgi:two-component system, chemotaxis family, CheB/CheR fusion protein